MRNMIVTIVVIIVALFLPVPAYQTTTSCQNGDCTSQSQFVLGDSIFHLATGALLP